MSNFEQLYDGMLLSIQKHAISDEYFMSALKAHNFVTLLKSLYASHNDADKEFIYSQCLEQGFRICDLQRALCLLNNERHDEPGPLVCEADVPVVEEQLKRPKDNSRLVEEYYLTIQHISEEEVFVGERNIIKIESNFFSAESIFKVATSKAGLSIDEAGDLLVRNGGEKLNSKENNPLNSHEVEVINEYNYATISCNDDVFLSDFYDYIRGAIYSLTDMLEIENCLKRLRRFIEGINTLFKSISIEKVINNKTIVAKCNQAGIYYIGDFIDHSLNQISVNEMREIDSAVREIDTTMPADIFNSWINKLPHKEHTVIFKRYLDGSLLTLESVGKIYNVTRERIRQVERKAIRFLLSPKRNKYRSALAAQLKLLSPHKSYISFSELGTLDLSEFDAIFLDKITGDLVFDSEYRACFFSRSSKDKLELCMKELPNEFTKTDLQEFSILISEELNGAFTVQEIVDLICKKCKVYGEYIVKSRITLKIVLSYLMQKYFPNGMYLYDDANIDFLRKKAHEEFGGFELAENNRAVRARLQDFCILVARGVWKYDTNQILISNELCNLIIEYIDAYKSPVLPIQAILDNFAEELKAIGIYNKYSLHGQLKKILSSDYSINRDYVFKSMNNSFYDVIEAYVKQSVMPVTKRDILNNFPGITDIVLQQIVTSTKVVNMNGYYVHLDNLNITDDEICLLKSAVDNELSDREIHHANMVFLKIKKALSGLFNRIGVNHYLQFYYLLREMFPNDFEYNRPFIGALGVILISGEAQVINLITSDDECSIANIRQYAKEVGTVIDRYIEFIDRNNDSFVFKNREAVITVSAVGLDDADFSRLDTILDEFIGEKQYRLLSDFCNYRELPDLASPWNTWLLYSVIKKFSKRYKLALTSNILSEAMPILVKQDFDESKIKFNLFVDTYRGESEQFDDKEDFLDTFDYDDLE